MGAHRFTIATLTELAQLLAQHGWTVGRDIAGDYYAQHNDQTVTIGTTKHDAGSHLLAMIAATQAATLDPTDTTH